MATSSPRPVTAVVGAGPAGLLFCLIARLRWTAIGREPSEWPILLFDKRAVYERTHRLRIDPEPFRSLGAEYAGTAVETLIGFLEEHEFRPEINHLEDVLSGLVRNTGINKELLVMGTGPGELGIGDLRRKLETEGRLAPGAHLSVVGADSVHSATRELVRGSDPAVEHVHHVVARLRVTGPGLPQRLSHLETFKLAKVLGSALDYRLNANGFAEVDLFLDPAEHAGVEALGASPRAPASVSSDTVRDAPFVSAIVGSLEQGLGTGPCDVAVQSTFRLEHRYQTHVVFDVPDADASVCLVGDAAISLPFFRGTAALAASARELAHLQADWAAATLLGDRDARRALVGYQDRVAEIRDREVAIVEARSRLVGVAREFIRLSSLLPFPIQQWFLSRTRPPRSGGRFTPGAGINLVLALAAGLVAIGAPVAGGLVWAPLGWLWFGAVPLQFLGGGAYGAAVTHEPGPNPLLARIWRLQVALLAGIGLPVTLLSSVLEGRPAQLFGALGWFLLGLVFAAGLVTYERIERRRMTAGELDGT